MGRAWIETFDGWLICCKPAAALSAWEGRGLKRIKLMKASQQPVSRPFRMGRAWIETSS